MSPRMFFVIPALICALLAGVGAAAAQERQEAFPLLADIPERPASTDAQENARRYREWVEELQAERCAMVRRMRGVWGAATPQSSMGAWERCLQMRQSRSPASSSARAFGGSGGQRPPSMDARTGRGE